MMSSNITLQDSLEFISSESSLFSLSNLYDDVFHGMESAYSLADDIDTFISTEDFSFSDIIESAKKVLKVIWTMIKNIFRMLKNVFMGIYRVLAGKLYIKKLNTLSDVFNFFAEALQHDTDSGPARVLIREGQAIIGATLIWMCLLAELHHARISEFGTFMSNMHTQLKSDEFESHENIMMIGLKIAQVIQGTFEKMNSGIARRYKEFMNVSVNGNIDERRFSDLSSSDWRNIASSVKELEPYADYDKTFMLDVVKVIDLAIDKLEAYIDKFEKRLDEIDKLESSSALYPEDKEVLAKDKIKLKEEIFMMRAVVSNLNVIKERYIVKGDEYATEYVMMYGYLRLMENGEKALKILIHCLKSEYNEPVDKLKQALKKTAIDMGNYTLTALAKGGSTSDILRMAAKDFYDKSKMVAEKQTGISLDKEIGNLTMGINTVLPSPTAESVMQSMLTSTSTMETPIPTFESLDDDDLCYNHSNLDNLIFESEYVGYTMKYSQAMEDVGLDIRNSSDFKSFKTQSVGIPQVDTKLINDKDHPVTSNRMTHRRFMILESIKVMIEALNSMRESLKLTVSRTRTDLDSALDDVYDDTDTNEIEVTIPATLVKSIYSHDYNTIVELMAASSSISIDGNIDSSSVDVSELDRRLRSLVRNRNKHLAKKSVKVKLANIIRTLRGKLAAFECILDRASIKPLAEKVPTVTELEQYQKYLMSLISLLKTDIIGTVIAANNIVQNLGGIL